MKRSKAVYWTMGVGGAVAFIPALIGGIWGWFCAHPPRLAPPRERYPDHWGVPFEEVTLETPDGLRLAAWYTPSRNGALVLVAHGFANARLAEIHALFARHGYGVLSWDFRAHGASEGTTYSAGYYETVDVETALDYALARDGVRAVGLWGASMGGIAGLRAAVRRPQIEALVLDSVPSTLEGTFDNLVPLAVLRPTFRVVAEWQAGIRITEIRPVDRIASLTDRAILVVHGDADRMIPPDSGQRLFQAAGTHCALWVVPGAGHTEAYERKPAAYEARVIGFLNDALQTDPLAADR
jgi:fermentation-respiration switch protein FrsA (DUF1100 family)